MTAAARELAETLLSSGARRVAFLGLAKNVGKTTALVETLAEMRRREVRIGTTSAGRDGEEFDTITGERKPRFRLWPRQLIASASSTFETASFASTELAALPFETRFGPIQIRRAEAEGEIEVIGPSTASQMGRTADFLEASGARLLLLDGAVGRRAFACARVADGIVLSIGMAAGDSLEAVLAAAGTAVELIRLPLHAEGAVTRAYDGALTEVTLRGNPPRDGETLLVEDFTAVFLSPAERRRLRNREIRLAARHAARLLAITANPTAPGRPPVPAPKLFDALRREFPETPLFDLVADLRSTEG